MMHTVIFLPVQYISDWDGKFHLSLDCISPEPIARMRMKAMLVMWLVCAYRRSIKTTDCKIKCETFKILTIFKRYLKFNYFLRY